MLHVGRFVVTRPQSRFEPGDALLLVDVQPDFCPGGALPVAEGDRIIPVLNDRIAAAQAAGVPVYASRDWHPAAHPSFREHGGEWPVHCVQDTPGARFHPELRLPPGAVTICKGTRLDRDQLSAFDGTGLARHLRERGVRRLFVGGLALDVCVRATVADALKEGFAVHLVAAATRAVDPERGRRALAEMERAGVVIETP
jgi:nicotinamidase/pyrazinamidase